MSRMSLMTMPLYLTTRRTTKMTTGERIAAELTDLLKAAKEASSDVSAEVEAMIGEGIERPLTKAEARRLLHRVADLARSVANNGVRRSPIIDLDGPLLDGNRRVTACHYVLRSPEFTSEQKKRAEWIYVWQLTEHATDEDRDVVVVSLNFEPDHKQD